jgi:hypothetical protein
MEISQTRSMKWLESCDTLFVWRLSHTIRSKVFMGCFEMEEMPCYMHPLP